MALEGRLVKLSQQSVSSAGDIQDIRVLGDGSGVREVGWRVPGKQAHSTSPASQSTGAADGPSDFPLERSRN